MSLNYKKHDWEKSYKKLQYLYLVEESLFYNFHISQLSCQTSLFWNSTFKYRVSLIFGVTSKLLSTSNTTTEFPLGIGFCKDVEAPSDDPTHHVQGS